MNWYLIIRFLHIVSAIVFIGGVFARQLLRSFAEKTDDVRNFVALNQAVGRIETFMVMPGNLGVILFGVILALITGTPILGFLQGASKNWLLVTIILLVFGVLTVPVIFVQRGKQFDLVLKDALAKGQMTAQLRAELDNKTIRFMYLTQIVLPMVIVVLMVFKPF